MKSVSMVVLALTLVHGATLFTYTSQNQPTSADRLGLTCTQILQLSSTDWVKKFTTANGATSDSTIRAINVYGKCYDARTSRLAAALGKAGRGPLMGARGNFGDFDNALKAFETKALAATDPPADNVKKAYAALYEKQFRHDFYRQYDQKNFNPPPLTPEESDAFTKAKNHFGELLGLLPEDKMHELHAAFADIFAGGGVPDAIKSPSTATQFSSSNPRQEPPTPRLPSDVVLRTAGILPAPLTCFLLSPSSISASRTQALPL